MREGRAATLPGLTNAGSFDCVVVRFANDNSAQDDNTGMSAVKNENR